MNISSREPLRTTITPHSSAYIIQGLARLCGTCIYLFSVVCLNFWEVWPGPPTDVLHIAVCSVLLSMNSS